MTTSSLSRLLQSLPVELTCLVFECALEQFLYSNRTWVLSLRATSHAVYDWVHPLVFADLIVTAESAAGFMQLVDSAEPAFFASTRSVHLLLGAGELVRRQDVSKHPKLASSLAHVRRWYGPLALIAQLPAIAPRELGVMGSCWLYTPLPLVARTLRTVSHLRLFANSLLADTGFVHAAAPQYVVMDAIAETRLLDNVQAMLALRTVRRVVVLLHAGLRSLRASWRAEMVDEFAALEEPRLQVVFGRPDVGVSTTAELFSTYRHEAERNIVHWDDIGVKLLPKSNTE